MLASLTLWVQAEDTVMVKTEAYVRGPMVLLGDVAEVSGDNAGQIRQIALSGAAAPGASKRLDAALIRARIEHAGIKPDSVRLDGASGVVAKTLAVELSQDILAEDLFSFIESQIPWKSDDAQIDVEHRSETIVVPDGEVTIKWWTPPQYQWVGPAVFRGEIRVDGDVKRTVVMKANVEAYAAVVVASVDIPRAKILSASDVRTEKRQMSLLRSNTYLDGVDAALGQIARTTIFQGQVIGPRQLTVPEIVKRNQLVAVETHAGGLLVRGRARAMGNAGIGDVVALQDDESKEQFTGVVRKDGSVVID
jgi:flagella basal body P-ring formation protein FlgA